MTAPAQAAMSWSDLTVWVVVNAVNVLQTAGFLSRLRTGGMATNHVLGLVIMALAIPAAAALVAFIRARSLWLAQAGPAAFLAFVLLMVVIEYIAPIEFRSPVRPAVLVPYLVLFFGAIVLMGLPMFSLNRRLRLVTVASSAASPRLDGHRAPRGRRLSKAWQAGAV